MPFKKILGAITWEFQGKCGAIVIDAMGEAVDMTGTLHPYRLRAAAAHQGVLGRNISADVRRLWTTEVTEIQIVTHDWMTYLIPIDRDYMLICMFENKGVALGRFLHRARKAIPELKKEMF